MASPPPIKAPDSPANTPLPESPTAWLEGGWTMIDPSEAGYSISFEEAEANEDLPVSVVQFIFRPDSSMTRSVDIVYGETVTSNGKWLIYGDTLEINYPADSAYGKGLFELRGDTLLLRHLRNGRPGKRIRLIRGLMTWNDLHPPAPEPPPIDSFANVRFDYPKHWRPSPPRDVGILTDLHTFEEYDRFERSHGGVRDEVANIGVNLYVYPYAASHYMGLVNNYNRPDRKDRVLRSMYMHSLPDRYLRSIYYELAPTTEYGDPASQVAKQGNAQFDRVSDFLTTKFGPPLEIDSTPRPTVDKGRTFWHRQGHWKSNGREALLRLSVSGGYDVNAVIYCE